MKYSEVPEGRYPGKILDYGISETKSGLPQVAITFGVTVGEEVVSMNWYGSFKPNAKKFTIDALLACGLQGNDPAVLVGGKEAGGLDINSDLSLVVKRDSDAEGNPTSKIAWVNKPMGSGVAHMEKFKALGSLQALGLTGDIMAARSKSPEAKVSAKPNGAVIDNSDVPF